MTWKVGDEVRIFGTADIGIIQKILDNQSGGLLYLVGVKSILFWLPKEKLKYRDERHWVNVAMGKQESGIKFEMFDGGVWKDDSTNGGSWTFSCHEKDYREAKPKPLICHGDERKLWLEQRLNGQKDIWTSQIPGGIKVEIPWEQEPGWYQDHIYELKPKTKIIHFGLFRLGDDHVQVLRSHDNELYGDFIDRLCRFGWTPMGVIEHREINL